MAFADTALGFLHVSQFADNEQFSNLEAMVVQVGAKECLFSGAGGSSDLERVSQVIERSGLMQTNCKRADFDTRCLQRFCASRHAAASCGGAWCP